MNPSNGLSTKEVLERLDPRPLPCGCTTAILASNPDTSDCVKLDSEAPDGRPHRPLAAGERACAPIYVGPWQGETVSLRPGAPPECSDQMQPVVQSTLRLLEEDLGRQPVKLRLLAERLCVSPWRLSRAFRMQVGVSFSHHVRTLRIRTAERLLARADLSIKEVAAGAGYAYTSDLGHDFKKFHGVSPREFRARLASAGFGAAAREAELGRLA